MKSQPRHVEVASPKNANNNSTLLFHLLPISIKIPFLPVFDEDYGGGGGSGGDGTGRDVCNAGVFGSVSRVFLLMRNWRWDGVPNIYQQNKFLEIVTESAQEIGEWREVLIYLFAHIFCQLL